MASPTDRFWDQGIAIVLGFLAGLVAMAVALMWGFRDSSVERFSPLQSILIGVAAGSLVSLLSLASAVKQRKRG